MKAKILTPVLPALLLPLLTLPSYSQEVTGYSHPDQSTDIVAGSDHYVKPSRAAAAPTAPAYQDSYPATATPPQPALLTREPEAITTPQPSSTPATASSQYVPYAATAPVQTAAVTAPAPGEGNDDGIVLAVPTRAHELNRGTLLHARLRETLSTQNTVVGTTFTAELLSDVGHSGEVMLPAGSLIRGHVSAVHGGKRISGQASMRLQPETVSLPDGTLYSLNAQVTDLDGKDDVRVNDEGTITARTHPKATAAVLGGVTATAAVTGAMIGGGVGAAVGAIAGAGVATAWWLKRDVQETLPAGATLIFALDEPLTVTPR